MTAEVGEFLKTCRFHYRTLTVVCLTALLFAIAPSEKQRLREAIQEAEIVSRMDFGLLLDAAVRDNPVAGSYMKKIEMALSSAVDGYSGPAHHALFPAGQFRPPDRSFSIERLQSYIDRTYSVVFNVPQLDDIVFTEIADHLNRSQLSARQLGELEYRGDARKTLVELRWYGGTQSKVEIDCPFKGGRQTEVHVDLKRLIHEDPDLKELLLRSDDGREVIFPCLHRFWGEIRDKMPRDAVEYLELRNAYVGDKIALLGLSIPASLTGIVVPITIIILVLHLHLYIRKLEELLVPEGEGPREQLHFPWLPLFHDRRSRTLTLAVYPVLPFVTNVFIVHRSFHLGFVWAIVLAIIPTAFLAFYLCPRLAGRLLGLSQEGEETRGA